MNRRDLRTARARFGKLKIVDHGDGPMAVIRPETPEHARLAVQLAHVAAEKNDVELFARLPNEVGGKYTFVGYLPHQPKGHRGEPFLVDEDGDIVGHILLGDSFVTNVKDEELPS